MATVTMADKPAQRPPGPTRAPDGTFLRTAQQAERDAEACRLRSRGMSYRAVATAMGIDVATAHAMVQRALADTVREAGEAVVTMELAKLDDYQAAVMRVLEARHYTVSNGRLIYLGDSPVPLEDDGPVLAAVDRLVRISESRRKLIGADAAQKIDTTATVKYTYEGVDTEGV
jgi:hypothetical protein